MAEIVFISLFLGLTAGVHPLELRADPAIKSIRVTLGANEVAMLRKPPWRTGVDFGTGLEPRRLTAIGFDGRGHEIGRTSQIINLPHPFADVSIDVKHEGGTPVAVELIGRHLEFTPPKSAAIQLDGVPLRMNGVSARLATLDWARPHVVSAEMTFMDGMVARRELVMNELSYVSESELTPVLVTGKAARFDGCFSADGAALRTSAVERTNALVVVVKDPDPREAQATLRAMGMLIVGDADRELFRKETQLDADTTERVVWPVGQRFGAANESSSMLFENSLDYGAEHAYLAWLLAIPLQTNMKYYGQPRRFADAVAVAALQTIKPSRRRAVVLLLSRSADKSLHTPAVVRAYLASIGVPLFVWSLSGPRPDLAGTWGEVVDISRRDKLRAAVDQLRRTLDEQSVVWLPVDPLAALRVKVKPDCGVETVARSEMR